MKKERHPQYEKTTISCACGLTYEVGSTKKEMKVNVCSNFHFFTGKQNFVDTGGRVGTV